MKATVALKWRGTVVARADTAVTCNASSREICGMNGRNVRHGT